MPVYVFYGDNDPEFIWEKEPAKVLLLSRSEALRACNAGDHVLISDEDSDLIVKTDGSIICYARCKAARKISFSVFPDFEKAPEGFVMISTDERGVALYESTELLRNEAIASLKCISPSDGNEDAVYELTADHLQTADDVYLNLDYAGYTAEIRKAGKKIADNFYIQGKWQIGTRALAEHESDQLSAELHIKPLSEGQRVYIYHHPEMKNGFAAEALSVSTEAQYIREIRK